MPQPRNPSALVQGTEKVAATLAGFDYGVDREDFVLYELHRLIEEERASFDDPEFRNIIDEGIRAHVQERLDIRAQLAGGLRAAVLEGEARTVALRVVHALEDVESDLCNVAVLVLSYTGYLFSRLDALESEPADDRIATAADLLFESTGDRGAAETALEVLCSRISPVTARVLAYAVSEPLLDEDLEARAFAALRASWPVPRHYMLYNLREHPHEDIPIRWFQLFVEVDEPMTVELFLEELRAHGENPAYLEDLTTLAETLQGCRDPELEDKILDAVNSTRTSPGVLPLLRKFLEEFRPVTLDAHGPWRQRAHAFQLNRQYIDAARAFEQGDSAKAVRQLNEILSANPDYPFALMLKRLIKEL